MARVCFDAPRRSRDHRRRVGAPRALRRRQRRHAGHDLARRRPQPLTRRPGGPGRSRLRRDLHGAAHRPLVRVAPEGERPLLEDDLPGLRLDPADGRRAGLQPGTEDPGVVGRGPVAHDDRVAARLEAGDLLPADRLQRDREAGAAGQDQPRADRRRRLDDRRRRVGGGSVTLPTVNDPLIAWWRAGRTGTCTCRPAA